MVELKTYKERVYQILRDYPEARNNDGTLWAHYIHTFHRELVHEDVDGNACIPLKYLKLLPPNQSLRLARQLIQNDLGEFLPTRDDVRKARNIKEKNIRDAEWREAKAHDVH